MIKGQDPLRKQTGMRITDLRVTNFKAIDDVILTDIGDVIVIAGPNGSGKSTIFDALKLWKTVVGSYQKDELQHWLTEQGFSQNSADLLAAHQRPGEPIAISATVVFSEDERIFIRDNADVILAFYFFRQRSQGQVMGPPLFTMQNLELNEEFLRNKSAIMESVEASKTHLVWLSAGQKLSATVTVTTDGKIELDAPEALKFILSIFIPQGIGVFDYYGSHRLYGRDSSGSVNLDFKANRAMASQTNALYNQASKFSGIKNELASDFVTGLISSAAKGDEHKSSELQESISELFQIFLPGKSFAGVEPSIDGTLIMNVVTPTSAHDIADLSSGEKELIYGYLRIRSRESKDSVILIDEPELHLNPRLTNGLIDFYYRHIGKAHNNQIWLVTHSDVILRQAVGSRGHKTYHMRAAGSYAPGDVQLVELIVDADVNRAFLDLVGDIAAYKPGGALVIVEGASHSEFDRSVITTLFPLFTQSVNLVSGGSRSKVHAIQEVISRVGTQQSLFNDVKSIVDGDNIDPSGLKENQFSWDRYNIENYLLNPTFIISALRDLILPAPDLSEIDILIALKSAAASVLEKRVRHDVEQLAYRTIRDCVDTSTPRDVPFSSSLVASRVTDTINKIHARQEDLLSATQLEQFAAQRGGQYTDDLSNGRWEYTFNGREVLQRFVQDTYPGVGYETLRNTIIAHMGKAQYQPAGMGRVLHAMAPGLPSV